MSLPWVDKDSLVWCFLYHVNQTHYTDVIMTEWASQITSLTIVYSAVYSGADQRKHQSSASLAFVRGIHRRPVNSPRKGPVTRKMFPFDDVIMRWQNIDWSMKSYCLPLIEQCNNYPQTSNIRCTRPQNLNVSRLALKLSLPKPLKPVV